MSTDTYIYIKDTIFPEEEWNLVLSNFKVSELKHDAEFYEKEWFVEGKYSGIYISLKKLIHERHLKAERFKWDITLSCSGKNIYRYWLLFSIPYTLMLLGNSFIFYNPQTNNVFDDNLKDLLRHAEEYLTRIASLEKLDKFGLLDKKENLILDVSKITTA